MRKRYLAAAVALVTLVFVAGFMANGWSQQGQREQLGIGGYAIIKAYHSDGALFSTWQGHNFLLTKGAIAACLSGQTSVLTGSIYAGCSAFTGKIYALACEGSSPTCTTADALVSAAIDTLQPPACASTFNFDTCNQWQAQVTFDSQITTQTTVVLIGTFPASSGLTSCTACAGSGGNFPFSGTFDYFSKSTSPPLSPMTLNSGDRLIVTITFTVP
jgi:hypothetical protein